MSCDCRTRENGSIDIEDVTGAIEAETRTGTIDVTSRQPVRNPYRLDTDIGRIALEFPADSSVKVDAQARTGSISSPDFLKVTRDGASARAEGTLGKGEALIYLRMDTGAISIETR